MLCAMHVDSAIRIITCVVNGVDVNTVVEQQVNAFDAAIHRCFVQRCLPGVVSCINTLQQYHVVINVVFSMIYLISVNESTNKQKLLPTSLQVQSYLVSCSYNAQQYRPVYTVRQKTALCIFGIRTSTNLEQNNITIVIARLELRHYRLEHLNETSYRVYENYID